MLCSCLLPTRARPAKLWRCLQSIFDHASERDFEILLRVDEDDQKTLDITNDLRLDFDAKVYVGPRVCWKSLNIAFTELASEAQGQWVWILNDDMMVTQGMWDDELRAVPTTGYIVQPAVSGLGGSLYYNAPSQAFPIVPRNCWKSAGSPVVPDPADTGLDSLLRRRGWQTWFLRGVAFWHDRDDEETINAHRR